MLEGQKSTFALDFSLTDLCYSCRVLALKQFFVVAVSCFVNPLQVGVASMSNLYTRLQSALRGHFVSQSINMLDVCNPYPS